MGTLLDTAVQKDVSRRTFVEGALAAGAALSLAGCSPSNQLGKTGEPASEEKEEPKVDPEEGAEWIPVSCWGNCGGRCLNKALVKDGIVLRQKTDDNYEDTPQRFQQRGCLRGRSMRKYIMGSDRVRYPLKRKSWQPGGGENAHGELRGLEEFEQISWDEATDLIAAEIKRVYAEYGPRSVFAISVDGNATNMYSTLGGFITRWGATSTGSWTFASVCIGLLPNMYMGQEALQDRYDLMNAENIVMVGMNPAWCSPGSPMYHGALLREKGIKFTAVDPFYNDSYAALEAKWIPVRPGTDTALFLGVAYEMLRLDQEEGGFINWDFLDKYSIGFDADHMPEGEDPAGNFKDYVLGTYDGQPKDTAWASAISGASEEDITYLARELAASKKTTFVCSWAPARCQDVDSWPQLFMTIGCMGGHIGKSGETTGICGQYWCFTGGKNIATAGSNGLPKVKNPVENDMICDTELWHGIVNGSYTYTGAKIKRKPAEVHEVDIHLMHISGADPLHSKEAMNKGIEAFRKMDTIIVHAHTIGATAKFADIVLPAKTRWETGGFSDHQQNPEVMYMHFPVMDGFYEAKSDQEIIASLCPKVGIDPQELFPISAEQQRFNVLAGSVCRTAEGEVPLITLTEEDIKEIGAEGEPQQGVINYQDYKREGVYQVEREPGDWFTYIPFKEFVEDPEANPLATESGKFEIYCRTYANNINSFGWSTVKPIPTYVPAPDGYGGAMTKEYPYQVFNPHYLRSSHYEFDENVWLREAWRRPLFMNPADAAREGIEEGDAVLLTSANGQIVRNVRLTERLMPGCLCLPHGGESDIDPETGIDLGGSDNMLTAMRLTGQGVDGYNSCLAKVEVYKAGGMPEDVERPKELAYED